MLAVDSPELCGVAKGRKGYFRDGKKTEGVFPRWQKDGRGISEMAKRRKGYFRDG